MTATLPPRLHHLEPRRIRSAGFEVVLHEGAARAARVVPGEHRMCVVVADPAGGTPAAEDFPMSLPTSSCTVWGHRDGSVQVRSSWAPPALLMRAADPGMAHLPHPPQPGHLPQPGHTAHASPEMVPQTPGSPGLVSMASGDRLLVLSSAAFEAAPQMVVRLLHTDAGRLLAAGPDELDEILHDLFAGSPDAGGALLTRL